MGDDRSGHPDHPRVVEVEASEDDHLFITYFQVLAPGTALHGGRFERVTDAFREIEDRYGLVHEPEDEVSDMQYGRW